jgi:signal transduction histidine kinase
MSARAAAWLAWSLCALTIALVTFVVVFAVFYGDNLRGLAILLAVVSNALVGAVLASHRPRNPVGWFFVFSAASYAVSEATFRYAVYGLVIDPGSLPLARAMAWPATWLWAPGILLVLVFLPLYFPDGRLLSPRWRPIVWLAIFVSGAAVVIWAFYPGKVGYFAWDITNPLGLAALRPAIAGLEVVMAVLFLGFLLSSVVSLVVRFRRSQGQERQQMKWLTYVAATVVGMVELTSLLEAANLVFLSEIAGLAADLLIAGIPVGVGIAVLRYRLYDIDVIINRTLVYGALSVIVVGVYILVVASLGALLQLQGSLFASLLATGLVAVIFAPLRERLQRAVNRLMYGQRDDPYMVLSGLGERLETTLAPNAVLPTIAESVAQALKLPYVAITLKHNTEEESVKVAEYGKKSVGEPLIVPLSYQKETVGELILSPRAPGESFSNSDLKLLGDLAHQVGVAAHGVRLTADLQRSRERLVTAREEERKRLRRDLHDGVGPQLAALTLKLETTRNLLSHDPKTAALMEELSERTRATVSDVRRSVHALRPPALDELGLVPALREGAAQYSQNGLHISMEAPESLPPLPAAVEVATYHIAQEAMTNVVRHAGASNCSMRITLVEQAGVLHLEVEDDGRGVGEDHKAGVGTHSMRERAEELGGRCTIEALPQRGTLVSAQLPCWTAQEDTHRQEE